MSDFLTTDRTVLRALDDADAEALFACRSDPDVARYQGWCPQSLDEVRQFIRAQAAIEPDTEGSWLQRGVYHRQSGQLIGDVGIEFPASEKHQAGFGVTIAPRFQKQGLAGEVSNAIVAWLFDDLQKHRIRCSVDPRNEASIALLTGLGFRREAHHVGSLWFRDEWVDDMIFALLRDEFLARR